MVKKPDTPLRKARRKYEQVNKAERKKATEQFNTRLPRKDYEEICAFLEEHGIRKIDVIYAGYECYRAYYDNPPEDETNKTDST